MAIKKEIRIAELRAANIPTGGEKKNTVEGYALVFGQLTTLFEDEGIEYKEIIDPKALVGCDMSDVPFKYNHSDNIMIMARTRNKTLSLSEDEKGLLIKADLANTTTGNDMYELIRRGDIDKMSFAFSVPEGGDSYDVLSHTRTIMHIGKLFDVSAVDVPAYEQTCISARSYLEARAKEEHKARESLEIEKERLKLKIDTIK